MTEIQLILGIILLWIVIAGLLAPLESLSWWAGWYQDADEDEESDTVIIEQSNDQSHMIVEHKGQKRSVSQYVVYLTGIAGISGDTFLPEERALLDKLAERLPDAVLVDDIYPYAVTTRGLTGQRVFARFWRWLEQLKLRGSALAFLINIRNMFQVLVAADSRYSPIYSLGSANVVLRGLKRHGYPFGSGMPVTLIGYSGGGEMSIGTISPLKATLKAPIRVISLGGVMSSDPCLVDVEHLVHLYGEKDRVHLLGPVLFPGRWRVSVRSAWNEARRDGRITMVKMGPMAHNGPGGYLDATQHMPNGSTYLDFTVDTIARSVQHIDESTAPESA